ncbi:MAG: DNA replication complex GINS family protein [Nitrososphaerota archaeon]|nr:DNA replication complex GINS family protein [Nitrososphaerota archaeon]
MIETLADKLNRLLEDENRSKDLLKINPNTYKEVAAHIKSIRSESSDKDRNLISELSLAERKILYSISRRLIELRISKFRDDPESDVTNLAPEERYVVEPLVQSRKRAERVAQAILNGQAAELERVSEAVKQKYIIARFLQPYSAVTGTDLGTYGPFEPEDVAILPIENAKNLMKLGIIAKNWIEPEE